MAGIDLNRTSAGVAQLLPREISQEIWSNAVNDSVIMQAARQINIPGSGVTIPIITGDAEADWVNETDPKPVSNATVSSKSLTPYKLAVIEPFSDEFRRDLPGLYAELARRLPSALGRKFDSTILNGTAPGSGFDVLTGSTAVAVDGTDVVDDLANVLSTVNVAGGDLSHWLISPQLEGKLTVAKDPGTGSYAFLRDARTDTGAIGSIFGRDVLKSKALYDGAAVPPVTGIAGDFANSAIWGSVEGIKVSISDQASLVRGDGSVIHLFQQNMFGIRVEVEVGFVVRDAAHFVKMTNDAA
ncbi:TPA: phage major capsid protein [Shigella flexneri]|nr:phage major capsid protein [Shigella flexneri]